MEPNESNQFETPYPPPPDYYSQTSRDHDRRDRGDRRDRRDDRERDRGWDSRDRRDDRRDRERDDRRDRDRDRERDRDRDRERRPRRSESPPPEEPRKKKKGLWDVPPPSLQNLLASTGAVTPGALPTGMPMLPMNPGGILGLPGMLPGTKANNIPLGAPGAGLPGLANLAGMAGLASRFPNIANALAAQTPMGMLTPQQQANRHARRLYIGNCPPTASDASMAEFFNQMMREKIRIEPKRLPTGELDPTDPMNNPHTPQPVINASVNHEKAFAFVEFRSPEEATAALAFDGVVFDGIVLKVRRPKDYVPTPDLVGAAPVIPGIVSTNVPDSPNKLFVGGLAPYMTEEQVKELLQAFGLLKAFHLVKDAATGMSKGFAFCEYLDESVTDKAIQGLNGMAMDGKSLMVQRAAVGAKASPMPLSGMPGMPLLGAMTMMPPTTLIAGTTRVLVLMNMLSLDDYLRPDDEWSDIVGEIQSEMSKHGTVRDVFVPRPNKDTPNERVPGQGKVFVEFEDDESAKRAQNACSGRRFNGRAVVTQYYPVDKWQERTLENNPSNIELEPVDMSKVVGELVQKKQAEHEAMLQQQQQQQQPPQFMENQMVTPPPPPTSSRWGGFATEALPPPPPPPPQEPAYQNEAPHQYTDYGQGYPQHQPHHQMHSQQPPPHQPSADPYPYQPHQQPPMHQPQHYGSHGFQQPPLMHQPPVAQPPPPRQQTDSFDASFAEFMNQI